ncbi:type 2A phosphatase-associated protein 42 [Trichomonascus vanleenenianus]|uniref:Tap42p n=1 Tax=Trichomonascus vanleenenianus TaxID=2268995 RepID=UPI003ECA6586
MSTLKELYRQSLKLKENLESKGLRQDTPEFRSELASVIRSFEQSKKLADSVAMFSSNEGLEDLNAQDIQYMGIDYYLGELTERAHKNPEDRSEILKVAVEYYLGYLQLLDSYGILTNTLSKKLNGVIANPKLEHLQSGDATARRADKIERFKLEKSLKEQLVYAASNPMSDDEAYRKLQLAQQGILALKAFTALENIYMELELLKNMPPPPPSHPGAQSSQDSREKNRNTSGYQFGKLDEPLRNTGPLLSKSGKVNRPFTIVRSRDQVKKNVFGTGQYLPTMTVEEYLEEELKQGGIIQGGGNDGKEESEDEDNMDKTDEETYKARKWDEFVEANPKGSGNTINRG